MHNTTKTILGLSTLFLFIWSGCKNDDNEPEPSSSAGLQVEFLSPILFDSGTIVRNVDIEVNARTFGENTIEKVEFFVDGELLENGVHREPPHKHAYVNKEKFGELRKITAVAHDNNGATDSAHRWVRFFNGVDRKPMPTSRYAFTNNVVNDKIYVIGGHDNNFKVVEEYDPATDTWTTKASPTFGHAAHASCVIDDIIYVFGGGDANEWTTNVEAYDPVTNTWTTKAPIPADSGVSIGMNTVAVANGKAYLMGGLVNPEPARMAEYDPQTDTWRILKSYKREYNAQAVTLNNTIYFMGGCPWRSMGFCDNPRDSLQTYDPIVDQWTPRASMLLRHTGHSATAHNGKIYVLGGTPHSPNNLPDKDAEVYDPSTDTWTMLPPVPEAILNSGCNSAHGKIYIIGPKRLIEFDAE